MDAQTNSFACLSGELLPQVGVDSMGELMLVFAYRLHLQLKLGGRGGLGGLLCSFSYFSHPKPSLGYRQIKLTTCGTTENNWRQLHSEDRTLCILWRVFLFPGVLVSTGFCCILYTLGWLSNDLDGPCLFSISASHRLKCFLIVSFWGFFFGNDVCKRNFINGELVKEKWCSSLHGAGKGGEDGTSAVVSQVHPFHQLGGHD